MLAPVPRCLSAAPSPSPHLISFLLFDIFAVWILPLDFGFPPIPLRHPGGPGASRWSGLGAVPALRRLSREELWPRARPRTPSPPLLPPSSRRGDAEVV